MKKDVVNEAGFLFNLGQRQPTVGSIGTMGTTTSTGLNAPGSKAQNIAKTTAVLTKQINDTAAKIAAAKAESEKQSASDIRKLSQNLILLQNQLNQLTTKQSGQAEQEETSNVSKTLKKTYKAVSKGTGQVMGARTGVPYAGEVLGKIGQYNADQMLNFLGLGDEEAETISPKRSGALKKIAGSAIKSGGKFAWQAAKPHLQQAASKVSAHLISQVLKKFNIDTGVSPEQIAKEIEKMPPPLPQQAVASMAKTPGMEKMSQKLAAGERVKTLTQKLSSARHFGLSSREINEIEGELQTAIDQFEQLGESAQTIKPLLEYAPIVAAIGSTAMRLGASNALRKAAAETGKTALAYGITSKMANKGQQNINNNEAQEHSMKKANKKKHKNDAKKKEELQEGILGGALKGAGKGAIGGAALGGITGAIGGLAGGPVGAALGALGGAAAGAGKGAAIGAPVGAIVDDDEESIEKLTEIQDKVVNALAKRKYYVNRVSYQFAEEEGGPTVFMTMKPNHYTSRYAEVDPNGLVNGETLEDFLKVREENEEKMLSAKQQRIAKLAGDPNKIDGADFAKLRAMKEAVDHKPCKAAKKGCKCSKCDDCKDNQTKKESVEIPTFLRAILQKNYAQADKYLGSIINGKIKTLINTALDKTL